MYNIGGIQLILYCHYITTPPHKMPAYPWSIYPFAAELETREKLKLSNDH